jgi:hypothetical protein
VFASRSDGGVSVRRLQASCNVGAAAGRPRPVEAPPQYLLEGV